MADRALCPGASAHLRRKKSGGVREGWPVHGRADPAWSDGRVRRTERPLRFSDSTRSAPGYGSSFVESPCKRKENLGYLAVSLGFYKTLFSAPGSSTSSEIPEEEQKEMGLSEGLIRFSIGLDNDIEQTYKGMRRCMEELGVLKPQIA